MARRPASTIRPLVMSDILVHLNEVRRQVQHINLVHMGHGVDARIRVGDARRVEALHHRRHVPHPEGRVPADGGVVGKLLRSANVASGRLRWRPRLSSPRGKRASWAGSTLTSPMVSGTCQGPSAIPAISVKKPTASRTSPTCRLTCARPSPSLAPRGGRHQYRLRHWLERTQ